MPGLSLDAGALIAYEKGDRRVGGLLMRAIARGLEIHAVPEVIAQVWRGGPRQARLARLLDSDGVEIPAYDGETARAVGQLCGRSGHHDVIDVHVVLHARLHDQLVITSDPGDLRAVDPRVRLVVV